MSHTQRMVVHFETLDRRWRVSLPVDYLAVSYEVLSSSDGVIARNLHGYWHLDPKLERTLSPDRVLPPFSMFEVTPHRHALVIDQDDVNYLAAQAVLVESRV